MGDCSVPTDRSTTNPEDSSKVYSQMKLWNDVRQFVLVDGRSKRAACRKFGLHWNTLQKMLDHPQPPGYRRSAAARPRKIDPFLPLVHRWLDADRKAPRKQKHTARRVFDRLREEHGFTGGHTAVKQAVREWKQTHAPAFVPLDHPMGQAQVDFGEAKFWLNGVETKAALFVMSLPYSDAVFIHAYPRECTESFQDGHARAFAFFGGVPARISYDNSRIAVKTFVGPRQRELTDGFLQLQSHYLFTEHFCLVRKANEKGHVENLVGYGRRNFLVPLPQVESFDQLNELLRRGCTKELTRSLAGKDGSKGERLDEERGAMRPLPAHHFEAVRVATARVNTLGLVHFQGHQYSVPVRCVQQLVTVTGDVLRVRIALGTDTVAEHPRQWSGKAVTYEPLHYLPLLERRPGAFEHAAPLKHWELPVAFGVLRRTLEADWPYLPRAQRPAGYTTGTVRFIRVLRLLEDAPLADVTRAVQRALELGIAGPDDVRLLLESQREAPVATFSLVGRPHLSGVHVATPDLGAYGSLMPGAKEGAA